MFGIEYFKNKMKEMKEIIKMKIQDFDVHVVNSWMDNNKYNFSIFKIKETDILLKLII